jgi:hypothetical protein
MPRVRVEIHQSAITAFFATNAGAQAQLRKTAETFKETARAASPVGTSMHWGKFKGTHGYFKREKRWQIRPFRGGLRVYNNDAFAHLVEYGSSKNTAYAPLRRAIRSFGSAGVVSPKGARGVARP